MAEVDEHVASRHERPEPRLVDPALAREPVAGEPEPLEPPVEVEARRRRPDEEKRQLRVLTADGRRRRSSSGIRLLALTTPKQPTTTPPPTRSGETAGAGHAGCGTTLIGPSKPAARARSRT